MRSSIRFLKSRCRDNGGFTLLEIIIVLTILSIMSILVVPRVSHYLGSTRSNFLKTTTIIAKTFDDAVLNDRVNFFMIHLHEPDLEMTDDTQEIFQRNNGVSVANLDENNRFVDSQNKLLSKQNFNNSFILKKVIFPDGSSMDNGNVIVPFYPQGYSDNLTIHVLVDNSEEWSIRIDKFQKEPVIERGFSIYAKNF